MPAMRAPSPAALRALRSLAFPSTSSSSPTSTICIPSRNVISRLQSFGKPSSRTFTTHVSLRSPPPPTSSPVSRPSRNRYAPRSHDRGPSSEEDTQTDFGKMDIFSTSNVAAPATSIDACTTDGFHLNNNVKITNYDGVLLVGGEAFTWSPHKAAGSSSSSSSSNRRPDPGPGSAAGIGTGPNLLDARGSIDIPRSALAVLEVLSPKPDLLLLGTGARLWMLGKQTREYLNVELGIRVDVMDTGNASSAYNLLAQERGVDGGSSVGAALLPIGWKGR